MPLRDSPHQLCVQEDRIGDASTALQTDDRLRHRARVDAAIASATLRTSVPDGAEWVLMLAFGLRLCALLLVELGAVTR